jgi:hypothetical protein
MVLRLLRVTAVMVCVAASSALADDYPYSGYFTGYDVKVAPSLLQGKCALQFYHQKTDGTSINYVLDQKTYNTTGQVQYKIANVVSCKYDSSSKIGECSETFYNSLGSETDIFYEILNATSADAFFIINFNSKQELIDYQRFETEHALSGKLGSGRGVFSQRCVGFNADVLQSHITGEYKDAPPGSIREIWDKIIERKDFSMVLDIMQQIGPTAANATLPGQ